MNFEHMEKQCTKKRLNTQNEKGNKQQNTPEPSGNNIATEGDKNVGSQPAKGTPQNRERGKLAQAKLLIAKMKLAITRQPNVNKEIKQGSPELEDIDSLEFITGEVLLELKKTTADIKALFGETLRKEVGETSSIAELVPRATLEKRDRVSCTSLVEVEEALKRTLPSYAGKIEIKLTNPNARKQRLALVKIEEEAAAKLLKAGRELVGFVSCRVRRRAKVRRCISCLDYGHNCASCKGPDRSKVCYYCGSTGHKIKECKKAPSGIKGLQSFPGGPCNSKEAEKKWMRVLQGNLNRSRTAHHLLAQLCSKKKADIFLISEQYQDRAGEGWYADELGTAAIWIQDPRIIHVSDQGSARGYVWVRHNSTTYVSVYLTPNDRIDYFQIKLDDLEDELREIHGDLIVAGDLNAKALEWGEARPDYRGRRIMEVASSLVLSVLNTSSTSTFRRPDYRETIPDVSLANEYLMTRVAGWQVIADYTGSDHQYILFDVHDRRPAVTSVKRSPRWNIARMVRERLSSVIEEGWRS
ncbi:uncharacterized protein LOC118450547 [Vespa mandarinia]|uniref:uncharacterized protein LOC118450547 n=1 Tax=Vespa mandarinia TaxID=7446 RepID=UPI00160E793E|nr:uncharacterized protein LOC118450547 [Vespa mandarinia]